MQENGPAERTDEKQQSMHRLSLLLVLHILPGILFAIVFFLLAKALMEGGATAYLALIISIPLCLVPMELGIMILWSKVATGSYSFRNVLGYQAKSDVIAWSLILVLLLVLFSVTSSVTSPLSVQLENYLTPWVPEWLTMDEIIRELSLVSTTQRRITFLLAFVFSGLVAPVIEEVYFRGFLLSKLESTGIAAPIINAFLFALYHFYFPWNVPAIFLGFTVIGYAVWARKNFLIGIVIHICNNLLGVLQLIWFTRV